MTSQELEVSLFNILERDVTSKRAQRCEGTYGPDDKDCNAPSPELVTVDGEEVYLCRTCQREQGI